jgi:hypothetical protein
MNQRNTKFDVHMIVLVKYKCFGKILNKQIYTFKLITYVSQITNKHGRDRCHRRTLGIQKNVFYISYVSNKAQ